jgi:hypothetical protein
MDPGGHLCLHSLVPTYIVFQSVHLSSVVVSGSLQPSSSLAPMAWYRKNLSWKPHSPALKELTHRLVFSGKVNGLPGHEDDDSQPQALRPQKENRILRC